MDEISLLTLNLAKKYTDEHGGGGGGTTDYEDLDNLPKINSVELKGNKSLYDLGIASAQSVSNITNGESINDFAGVETALDGVETALATKQNATDNSLDTEAKTIVGAINENAGDIDSLKSGLTTLDNEVNGDATVYPYANVITIEDAVPANLADCNVKIEPVQDLHGQSAPYVGGAGKNKLPMTVDDLKTANTDGTWSGDTYTLNGVSFTILKDADGNVTGVKTGNNQTATGGNASFNIVTLSQGVTLYSGQYIGNGCPANGSTSTYYIRFTGGFEASNEIGEGTGVKTVTTSAISVYIRVMEGATVSDLVFTPMIRLATETDATFAPYTNICPISGHTESVVTRVGKNTLDVSTYTANKYLGASGDEIDANSYAISKFIRVKPSTQYVASGVSSVNGTYMAFYDADKNFLSSMAETADGFTFTTPNSASYVKLSLRNVTLNAPQLEEGQTATPYEPYQGKTYTIALGDTIYGGTVDFDSGVMTVTRGYYKPASSSGIHSNSGSFPAREFVLYPNPIGKQNGVLLSNMFTKISSGTTAWGAYITSTGSIRLNTDSTYNSAQDAYDAVLKDAEFVYEVKTPTTIQLTPQQIQLLKGQNTIYASTGDISVTVNGVSGSIGALTEDVAELQGQIDEIDLPSNPSADGSNLLRATTVSGETTKSWVSESLFLATVGGKLVDCNTETSNGIIRVLANSTNMPSGAGDGVLIVFRPATDNVCVQMFIESGGKISERINWYGTWSGWKTMAS